MRFADWPLATKTVVVCVGLAAALALVLTTMGYLQASRGLREQAEAALHSDALLVADAIDNWHAERLGDLEILARLPAIRRVLEPDPSPAAISAAQDALDAVDTMRDELDSVGLLNSAGQFILSSNRGDVGQAVPQRDYFQVALRGSPFITGVAISVITNQEAIFHSVPVQDASGAVIGVLRSRASLGKVEQIVNASHDRVGAGAVGVLLDQNGLVIANTVSPDWQLRPIVPLDPSVEETLVKGSVWGRNPPPPPLDQQTLTGALGLVGRNVFTWPLGDTDYHAMAVPLHGTSWSYVVALPVPTWDASARDFRTKAIITALLALLVTALLALWYARHVADTLGEVTLAARGLAEGDLNQRITLRSKDELGQMADAFRSLIAHLGRLSGVANAVAHGDRTVEVEPQSEHDTLGIAIRQMAHDVRERETQLIAAEEQVRRSETHFRSLIENATDIITVLDHTQTIRYESPSVQRVLGFESTELVGQEFRAFVHPDDGAAVTEAFDRVLANPDVPQSVEFRFRHRYDVWRILEGVGTRVLDANGNATIVLNSRDVTRRKEAEEAVRQARDQLEERVAERTNELQTANAELAEAHDAALEASQAKSAFLANMSHELRTPLNAIISFSEILQEDAEEAGQEDFIPDLEEIHTAGKHLLALINDILDLSKIEAGKMELYLESFQVDELLRGVTSIVQPLMDKNGNTLVVETSDDLGTMHADQTKVRQTLLNLLSNAAKFTDHGTVTLDVRREARDAGDWLTFRVIDSGIGMTAEQMERLFQAFSQADASTTRKYGGTGLGLAISRRFCQMMGGDVTVASDYGHGSTFTIELPAAVEEPKTATAPALDGAAPEPPARADSPVRAPLLAGSIPTVLVIDDDPIARDIVQRHLQGEGFQIITAASGEEGLQLARAAHPAAITLDVLMPGMDGWAVLAALKADPALADIPTIMLTMLDDNSLGYALGASEFITKPVERDRLLTVLAKHLGAPGSAPVLVVEDNGPTREALRRTLEREGWAVDDAANGRVALERVAARRPALILLDLEMPEMDGFEFLAALRQEPAYHDIPVVVVTAMDLTAEDRARLNGHVEKIVQKGAYERDQLLAEVRALIAASVSPPAASEV
jgi:PAS domain S-box-containing protein